MPLHLLLEDAVCCMYCARDCSSRFGLRCIKLKYISRIQCCSQVFWRARKSNASSHSTCVSQQHYYLSSSHREEIQELKWQEGRYKNSFTHCWYKSCLRSTEESWGACWWLISHKN